MALNIPLPGSWANNLFEGVQQFQNNKQNAMRNLMGQQELQQQQMQHAQNLDFNKIKEARMIQEFLKDYALKQETENRKANEFELKKQEHPGKLALQDAKIKSEEEKAKVMAKGGNQRLSAAVQEALYLYGSLEDPRAQQYIFDRNKIIAPEEYRPELKKEGIPEGATSFNNLNPGQRKAETDRQNKSIDQGESWKHIFHQLDQADKILDANPDLADSAASIIEEAGSKSKGYLNPILNRLTNKNKRTAVQSLDKIYSDIVLNLDAAMPGRGSVFKLQTITAAKGRSKNTNETNKFINNSFRQEGTPFVNYAKDLKKVKGKYSLDFDRDKYSRITEKDEVPDMKGQESGGSSALVSVTLNNGEVYDIPAKELDKFMIAHKDHDPQIELRGSK